MASAAETKLGQTQDKSADAYRNSSREHWKMRIVPVGVIALWGLVYHLIPEGWPTRVEEVAICGYFFEYVRQSHLAVRDLERARKAEMSGTSAYNASSTQSP